MLSPSRVITPECRDEEWNAVRRVIAELTNDQTIDGKRFTSQSPDHLVISPVRMTFEFRQIAMVGSTVKVSCGIQRNHVLGPSPNKLSRFDFLPYNAEFVAQRKEGETLRWIKLEDAELEIPADGGLNNETLAGQLVNMLISCRVAYQEHYES